MKYATLEQVLNYLLLEVNEEFESQIEEWIEQTSQEITRITGRDFGDIEESEESEEDEERLFDGQGTTLLVIDDLLELTSIEQNDNEIEDVYAYPANTLPKTYLKGFFPYGFQNIKITGKWGYSELPPEDITFACVVMTAGIIQSNLAGVDDIKSEKIGEYQITYKDDKELKNIERTRNILNSYKRHAL